MKINNESFSFNTGIVLSSCASTQTEKQKEDRKKLTIIRTIGCVVVPTLIHEKDSAKINGYNKRKSIRSKTLYR